MAGTSTVPVEPVKEGVLRKKCVEDGISWGRARTGGGQAGDGVEGEEGVKAASPGFWFCAMRWGLTTTGAVWEEGKG